MFDWDSSLSCFMFIRELNTIYHGLFFQGNHRMFFLEKCVLAWLFRKSRNQDERLKPIRECNPRKHGEGPGE